MFDVKEIVLVTLLIIVLVDLMEEVLEQDMVVLGEVDLMLE